MAIKKLIPDKLRLTKIPDDEIVNGYYFNKIIEGYNNRVDNLNEYYKLYCNTLHELEDFKIENKIMTRFIKEHGLWETLLNDDEFVKHLREDG